MKQVKVKIGLIEVCSFYLVKIKINFTVVIYYTISVMIVSLITSSIASIGSLISDIGRIFSVILISMLFYFEIKKLYNNEEKVQRKELFVLFLVSTIFSIFSFGNLLLFRMSEEYPFLLYYLITIGSEIYLTLVLYRTLLKRKRTSNRKEDNFFILKFSFLYSNVKGLFNGFLAGMFFTMLNSDALRSIFISVIEFIPFMLLLPIIVFYFEKKEIKSNEIGYID